MSFQKNSFFMTLLSLLIAIASSALALYLVCRDKLRWGRRLSGGTLMGLGIAPMHYIGMEAKWATFSRMGAAVVMGCAIIGMHYTGMAASRFPLNSFCGATNSGIDTKWLAVLVIIVSLAVFAIALIVSMLDVRTNRLSNSLDDANSELIKQALRQSAMVTPFTDRQPRLAD
jgi:NO-binding membrane sensor protein with MHYT domain